jgi:hypothetical protein
MIFPGKLIKLFASPLGPNKRDDRDQGNSKQQSTNQQNNDFHARVPSTYRERMADSRTGSATALACFLQEVAGATFL